MQYLRPARIAWCLALVAGCGSAAQPAIVSPDGAAPATQADAWPGATDASASPEAAAPAPDAQPGADLGLPEPDAAPPSACGAETAPLRRLTTAQYQRTVRELTGVTVTTSFPVQELDNGFEDRASIQTTSALQVAAWRDAAEEIVAAVSAKLPALTGCATIDDACAKAFITSFGLRAYRRPLSASEVAAHLTVYAQVKALGDASDGILAVLRVMLQSPHFLYRPEIAGVVAAGSMTPNPYEIASRLSYFLWGNMPDETLFDAAARAALGTSDQIDAQIRRMLLDTRARQGTNDFVRQWLSLDAVLDAPKDPATFPAWNATLAAAMREEGYRFSQQVIFDRDGLLSTLLTSTEGIVNGPLAQLYGVTITGTDWQSVQLTNQHRLGLLTQGWFLAARANIARRGAFVRERLFCQLIPPPPPNFPPPPPPIMPGATNREGYQSQLAQPACAGCHSLFDGLGFTFESYDGIGAFRTTDNGKPVDSSGEITGGTDVDGKVTDSAALIRRLAASTQVRDCVATRWSELAAGRSLDGTPNDCRLSQVQRQFRAGNGNLRDLAAAIALSAARRPRPASEVSAASTSPLIVAPSDRLSMQKIVLDTLGAQLSQLRLRLNLPDDRMHLDQHLEGLRDLEKRLGAP